MRVQTILISERNLMFVVGGQLFDQAPNRQPRKVETIMQKLRDSFRALCYNQNEWYSAEVPRDDTYKFIEKLLMDIPELVELNLTQVEFEAGVSVDDESRPPFAFSSRYDKETSKSWKSDFIDLDAFIRNVHGRLLWLMDSDQDCFCCKNNSDINTNEVCKDCLVNPNLKYNYQELRLPKGIYTIACTYNCKEHKYICCEECEKVKSCTYKCDGNPDTCGNKV